MLFVAGAFAGFVFGVLLMAMMVLASGADDVSEALLRRMDREDGD